MLKYHVPIGPVPSVPTRFPATRFPFNFNGLPDERRFTQQCTRDRLRLRWRPARRSSRARTWSADRGTVRRQDPVRPRRRHDQDRAAGNRRPVAQVAAAARRDVGLVGGPVAQQALGGDRPAPLRGTGHRAPAGPRDGRAHRELPSRHAGRLGPGIRRAVGGQSGPGHAAHLRLRPDGPIQGSPRIRRGRRSHGRAAAPDGRTGPGDRTRRGEHRRYALRASRHHRRPGGLARARPQRRTRAGGRRCALRGGIQLHGEPAAGVQRLRRRSSCRRQFVARHRPEQRLPLQRRLGPDRRQWRQHLPAPDARPRPRRISPPIPAWPTTPVAQPA